MRMLTESRITGWELDRIIVGRGNMINIRFSSSFL